MLLALLSMGLLIVLNGLFVAAEFVVLTQLALSLTAAGAAALAALIASISRRPSSRIWSSTPQVKAPCEPPPCSARSIAAVSGFLRGRAMPRA